MTEECAKKPECCCLLCKHYEARSQFCRKNPPTPVAVPDKYGAHMMSAFPKIPCPQLDYCSYFTRVEQKTQLLSE